MLCGLVGSVRLAGQKDDAESALNLVLGEIKVAVYAMVARGEKPTQERLSHVASST